jgi:hypothetical protein
MALVLSVFEIAGGLWKNIQMAIAWIDVAPLLVTPILPSVSSKTSWVSTRVPSFAMSSIVCRKRHSGAIDGTIQVTFQVISSNAWALGIAKVTVRGMEVMQQKLCFGRLGCSACSICVVQFNVQL